MGNGAASLWETNWIALSYGVQRETWQFCYHSCILTCKPGIVVKTDDDPSMNKAHHNLELADDSFI